MRTLKLFTFATVVFFVEAVLLGLCSQSVLPLFNICLLAAVITCDMPWYMVAYLYGGSLLSASLQGFSLILNGFIAGACIVVGMPLRAILEHHLVVQTLLIASVLAVWMWFDCQACLTVCNFLITILIIPFMITFLQ